MKLPAFLKRIGNDNSGATAIEYGLIASLIVVGAIGALDAVANENTGLWAVVTSKISASMTP